MPVRAWALLNDGMKSMVWVGLVPTLLPCCLCLPCCLNLGLSKGGASPDPAFRPWDVFP